KKPMKISTIITTVSLFFIILTGIRIAWLTYQETPPHPTAQHGFIDLSEWEFTNKQNITLNGEWAFYPHKYIQPEESFEKYEDIRISKTVPGSWGGSLFKHSNKIKYGTYHLQVK